MNQKEVSEIRRRFRAGKSDYVRLRGCFVNEKREIISHFASHLGALSGEEGECLVNITRKTLSGTVGRQLTNIEFSAQQVMAGEEHALLSAIRTSGLSDEAACMALYERIISTVELEGNFLILLAYDSYDVPQYQKDGNKDEAGNEEFSFFTCSVCPVKQAKPALSYHVQAARFLNRSGENLVAAPALGFLFPAFDERSCNLYGALYYSKDVGKAQQALAARLFGGELPLPPQQQKEAFGELLAKTIGEDCSYQVVQAVEEQLSFLVEAHKESKSPESLEVTGEMFEEMLERSGVSDEHLTAFREGYRETFGESALSPVNLIKSGKLEITLPEISIKVGPEARDGVKFQMLNGHKYVLIRADQGVQVNGVEIEIVE